MGSNNRFGMFCASLEREIRTAQAIQQYESLRATSSELRSFDSPSALVACLVDPNADTARKEALIRALVLVARRQRELRQLAQNLVLLGLRPALGASYRRCLRRRSRMRRLTTASGDRVLDPLDELVEELLGRVHHLRLEQVPKLLVRLAREPDRVLEQKERLEQRLASQDTRLPKDDSEGVLGAAEQRHSQLDAEELAGLLSAIVGTDAALIIGTMINGETQRELGERLGLSHEAVRKRVERAKRRLRRHLRVDNLR